jgi:hypothetical protein
MRGGEEATPNPENPFTRPWFLVSAGVVVLVLILAVVYALLPPVGAAPSGQPTPNSTSASTQPSAASGGSVCGLPEGKPTIPGPGLTSKWELNGKTAVPTDPTVYGPGKSADGARTCYARNPTGALYAAANFLSASVEQQGTVMVKDLIAKGEMRDKYLASPMEFGPKDATLSIQVGGFRVQSYVKETAVVVLGVKGSNGTLFSLTVPLKWEDGDWKVNLESLSRMAQVTTLNDFVPWAGV